MENIVAVFTRLGGTATMAEWARRNQTEFYRLYARLIPSESTTEINLRDVRDLSTLTFRLRKSTSTQCASGSKDGRLVWSHSRGWRRDA